MEIASEYGVDRDFVFDAIENATTGGVLQGYFKNIPSVESHKKTNSKHGE
ncbi:MAG: spore protein [Clostridioides difficile]|nr:spore protein [Clostridioides difficile]